LRMHTIASTAYSHSAPRIALMARGLAAAVVLSCRVVS
jgi:hypothetical protein